MSKIIVLQGAPASGKSTWAREFVTGKKDWVIVNRDSIRDGRGDYWIPEQEGYISSVEEFQIRTAITNDLNVIIDATNLNPKTIEKWGKIAEEYCVEIEYKLFEIPYKEALERDSKRARPVGKKVIDRFYRMYCPHLMHKLKDDRIIKESNPDLIQAVICDIDGTVSLRNGRSPFDYSKVKEDTFDPRMREVLMKFINNHIPILFVSGREDICNCRKDTEEWIEKNLIGQYKEKLSGKDWRWKLIMRGKGDHRGDEVVKKELYDNQIKPIYDILCVFDDRDKVVKMWRDEGLLCCQVYYGDF